MIARRILVEGRVQGVFYRNWTVAAARELGLKGWVRNVRSGEVEIFAMGDESEIQALIERCRNGPSAAEVTNIRVSDAEAEPAEEFSKRPTV